MDRRTFLGTLAGSLLAAPLAVEAQQTGRPWRVGLLDFGAPDASSAARWKAFREQLHQLGYVEGRDVVFESRWGNGHAARLPGLAAGLGKIKVDIMVTVTGDAAVAARQATRSIPIVMATGPDPVRLGLASSLARPGGNVTGMTTLTAELSAKRVELLKEVIPRAARLAVLRDPDNRGSDFAVQDMESKATSQGLVLQIVDATGPTEFNAAFATIARGRADAVILAVNTPFLAHRRQLAELAISHLLPLVAETREYAEAGALLSYATDYPALFRRVARYVDKILKGAKPADLPIEQPTQFELVINLKTAKALGLTIPPSLLQRADQVIE